MQLGNSEKHDAKLTIHKKKTPCFLITISTAFHRGFETERITDCWWAFQQYLIFMDKDANK